MARGYIRKRGERSWQLVYDVPRGANGKRQQRYETVYGNKPPGPEARLTQVLESVRQDRYFEPSRLTLADFLDQFVAGYVEPNCRPSTTRGYRDMIRVHLKPGLGHVPLSRLTAWDIQHYYAEKLRDSNPRRVVEHPY